MAKAKKPAKLSTIELERRVAAQLLLAQNRFIALENQAKALEEAICPRVAARLTSLERHVTLQQEENQAVFKRLNTDDLDKKRVFEVLSALRGAIVGRVQALEQDVSAINKSIAILSEAVKPKDAQPGGTPGSYGETTARSKADDRGIVSYMITKLKNEMGIEFTEQGMKRIISLIEKV